MATSSLLPESRALLILLLAGLLGGCSSGPTFRTADAPDGAAATAAAKAAAPPRDAARDNLDAASSNDTMVRAALSEGLRAGLASYRLSPGDVVEILFHISTQPAVDRYRIGVGDVLEIDFYYTPELNRTVTVRPDGRITLPRIGELAVAGSAPEAVSLGIREAFANILQDPEITVGVKEFTERTEMLTAALNLLDTGQSKRVPVDPGGMLHLPFIGALPAAGMTLEELTQTATAAYRSEFGNLRVSMLLDSIVGNRVFVFGEVRNPGAQAMTGPTSVAQAIVGAGGPLTTAALNDVRLIYAGADGQPEIRSLSLGRLRAETPPDFGYLVPSNSTIYVPPSTIARLNRLVDQYVKQLFLFTGWGIGLSYELNPTKIGN